MASDTSQDATHALVICFSSHKLLKHIPEPSGFKLCTTAYGFFVNHKLFSAAVMKDTGNGWAEALVGHVGGTEGVA